MRRFIVGVASLFLLATSAVASIPLGISNNNPGNIIRTNIQWKGEIECTSRFECFDTAENGLRALALNLLSSYNRHGNDTPRKILQRWSPPHENDTESLVEVFHRNTGIGPDEKIKLENHGILRLAMNAIITQENGMNPYRSMIDGVIASVLVQKVDPLPEKAQIPSGYCHEDPPVINKKKSLLPRQVFFHTGIPPKESPSYPVVKVIHRDKRSPVLNYL